MGLKCILISIIFLAYLATVSSTHRNSRKHGKSVVRPPPPPPPPPPPSRKGKTKSPMGDYKNVAKYIAGTKHMKLVKILSHKEAKNGTAKVFTQELLLGKGKKKEVYRVKVRFNTSEGKPKFRRFAKIK